MAELQRRFLPNLRYDSERKRVSGIALRYGDVADLSGYQETFRPGAFSESGLGDVIVNVQHDRGRPIARVPETATLTDTETELTLSVDLSVDTTAARDSRELVERGILRGLSIEFLLQPGGAEWKTKDLLEVSSARLLAVALVDRPAYPDSTLRHWQPPEARRRKFRWL